ncbi:MULTISPECIES: adenylate cyclase [unclassified Treponema]|uniref:adenylate cyclase n=1 Tax=unclassified Treponema TaxID=2638727 RepID=UPI000530154F|nr:MULTISPECIES: adenylate cyclase [unclassified Treponema]AIW90086.1 adenylate cyclase [Treponema sp. OMZ 838]UTC49934.1 adenylate cyclase [Treponema sp. OMZ 855]
MHEIELKAHLEHPEKTEALLSRIADFSLRCTKTDRYWTLGEKTVRVRRELIRDKETVFVTHKQKHYTDTIETNRELEFELAAVSVPVFTEMLESLGMTCTTKKQKETKVFVPHSNLFSADILEDTRSVSAELSFIHPIGYFLEIEVLYPDEGSDTAAYERHIRNAQIIFDTLLDALAVPQSAIEIRPYDKLLALQML